MAIGRSGHHCGAGVPPAHWQPSVGGSFRARKNGYEMKLMSREVRDGEYQDRQWHNVLNVFDVEYKEDTFLNVDARMGMFIIGYSTSAAMIHEHGPRQGIKVSICLP